MQPARRDAVVLADTVGLAPDASAPLMTGRIVAADEDGVAVDVAIDGVIRQAQIATSCLIRPISGDRVLAFRTGDEVFVLNVLERIGPNYATLALPGHGNLAIEGETLSLTGRQRLALKSDRIDLQAKALAFVADRTTWLSKALSAIVERFHVSARSHETSAETLIEKSVNRTAIVDQTDSLRAQMRTVKITGVTAETAQSKVIAVADDLRMDGQRITMG
jgi:hypothetical protein